MRHGIDEVRETLEWLGFRIDEKASDRNVVYASNDVFNLECYNGKVRLGVRKTFDRWANSTDFEFSVPKTAKRWQQTLEEATQAALTGQYGDALADKQRGDRYVNRSR